MDFFLFWGPNAAWLALFIWIAWTGRGRLLLMLGAAMLLGFAVFYVLIERAMALPDRNRSTDMAYGMLILLAAEVLLLPLVLAAIIYPIGRLWAR